MNHWQDHSCTGYWTCWTPCPLDSSMVRVSQVTVFFNHTLGIPKMEMFNGEQHDKHTSIFLTVGYPCTVWTSLTSWTFNHPCNHPCINQKNLWPSAPFAPFHLCFLLLWTPRVWWWRIPATTGHQPFSFSPCVSVIWSHMYVPAVLYTHI